MSSPTELNNTCFMGTSVQSGTAIAVVVTTLRFNTGDCYLPVMSLVRELGVLTVGVPNRMDNLNFDSLLTQYKAAIDHWIEAIRNEESLATPDHSMVAMEKWDDAGFAMQDAEAVAKKARDQYKNALRKKNYGF